MVLVKVGLIPAALEQGSVPATLSSWKEIAQYLNKGVRTVPRWEREMGLPVRRPNGRSKGVVLASTQEIDEWLYQQTTAPTNNLQRELEKLRTALAEVMAENQALRIDLESLLKTNWQSSAPGASTHDVAQRAA